MLRFNTTAPKEHLQQGKSVLHSSIAWGQTSTKAFCKDQLLLAPHEACTKADRKASECPQLWVDAEVEHAVFCLPGKLLFPSSIPEGDLYHDLCGTINHWKTKSATKPAKSAWCSGRKNVSMPEQTKFTCILSFSSPCPSEVTAIFSPAAAAFQENGCIRTG